MVDHMIQSRLSLACQISCIGFFGTVTFSSEPSDFVQTAPVHNDNVNLHLHKSKKMKFLRIGKNLMNLELLWLEKE